MVSKNLVDELKKQLERIHEMFHCTGCDEWCCSNGNNGSEGLSEEIFEVVMKWMKKHRFVKGE